MHMPRNVKSALKDIYYVGVYIYLAFCNKATKKNVTIILRITHLYTLRVLHNSGIKISTRKKERGRERDKLRTHSY